MWKSHRTRADLVASGMTGREITVAVRAGALIRARRDRYLSAEAPDAVVRAVRVGGRLTCLSVLQMLEIFVLTNSLLHVHLPIRASRMRAPHDRKKALNLNGLHGTRLHWSAPQTDPGVATCLDIVHALAHSVLCQGPRAAVASIDSALNKALIEESQIDAIFDLLPRKYVVLRGLVDGRAESGPETFVRLMVLSLGSTVELQVVFKDIGRVDLVVDGWLVIECDSKAHHSSWEQQLKDYRRDLALAKLGYSVLRFTAEDILYRPDEVMGALRGVLGARGRR